MSYAQANKDLVSGFLEKFNEQISPSRLYEYILWRDVNILVGENWHNEIQSALAGCDIGILLISPSFLGSQYITKNEISTFLGNEAKPVVPIMLRSINFERHDLKGIQEHQIFRFIWDGLKKPRAYGDCKGNRRNDFVCELFNQIELRLDKFMLTKK